MTDQNKHIEKLKKLLALAASGNPHEAALALRRARKLMDVHGITHSDIAMSDIDETISQLIKADDRALSVDEYFWRHILHRGHQRVLFVVTQADKTEPCHEWDMAGIQPSPVQAQNIREKTEAVFRLFRPVHPVVAVSARTGWELDTLVSALMTALPDHAASP
uniref:DUF2786 domain-containing protein n=1 Tax=Escherichia coli TaxID=562 RepID=UPI0020234FC0